MAKRLVECVPNFSEGRDTKIIGAIADAVRSVKGVRLLDVDPGQSTNRTVFTFVGEPDDVIEAAYRAIERGSQLIDMREHSGAHPRMGACDVCPFVPVSGVSMADCVEMAKTLAQKVGAGLGIPVYLYGEAAQSPSRVSLADIRQGEYEGLSARMQAPDFAPDFGPGQFNAKSGATVIGARQFLVAYNVNLNTRSKKLANQIALSIREAGRAKRDSAGQIMRGADGNTLKEPGTLKECRAVGWYVDEYERAQVSINLTDYTVTSIHAAFDEVVRQAQMLGVRVTGSEVVGLVPLTPMLAAGEHYLRMQGRTTGVSESELLTSAIQSLGLAELAAFDPAKKIVEYSVAEPAPLLERTLTSFVDELASESPAPGGGSAAALCGSLSAALSAMVANLSFEKKGMEKHKATFEQVAKDAQALKKKLLYLVDEDMQAFNSIIDARRLPKATPTEIAHREDALVAANLRATTSPLAMLKCAPELLELAAMMVEQGNPASLSDAGVAALTALAAAEGAYYNVLINLGGLGESAAERIFAAKCLDEADCCIVQARQKAETIRLKVLEAISRPLVAK